MRYNLDREILGTWAEFNADPSRKQPMTKADRKEYKRLIKWREFLQKKQNKLYKQVELYHKLDHILAVELYNAIKNIEKKYQ